MKTKLCRASVLMVLAFITLNCSSLNKPEAESEKFQIDKGFASIEGEKLHKLVKEEQFDEIYENTSFCMKECYSREKFREEMFEAVGKLRAVDPRLDVWTLEQLDSRPPPYQFYLVKGYGIGDSLFNPDHIARKTNSKDKRNFAYIMTYWQNEDGIMKLTGYQVMKTENGTFNSYGTSFCITTDKTVTKNAGKTITKARIVIDGAEERQIIQTVSN